MISDQPRRSSLRKKPRRSQLRMLKRPQGSVQNSWMSQLRMERQQRVRKSRPRTSSKPQMNLPKEKAMQLRAKARQLRAKARQLRASLSQFRMLKKRLQRSEVVA